MYIGYLCTYSTFQQFNRFKNQRGYVINLNLFMSPLSALCLFELFYVRLLLVDLHFVFYVQGIVGEVKRASYADIDTDKIRQTEYKVGK